MQGSDNYLVVTHRSLTTCLKGGKMFATNGRTGKRANKARASVKGKEFSCTACGKRKRVANVEFGEEITCECGKHMVESYEE